MFLYRSEGLVKHMDNFSKLLTLLQLKGGEFCWTLPISTDDIFAVDSSRQLDLFYECANSDVEANLVEIEKELSTSDIIKELGYGCTANTSHCMDVLRHFLPLSEVTLAKLLGTIACTRTSLEDGQNIHSTFCSVLGCNQIGDSVQKSWNIEVLVDSIRQLAPETNWVHVFENLDYEEFNIPDEAAFCLLMSTYKKACQGPFPLHAICGHVWKNTEGQLSLLKYAIAASPDVFTFSHCVRKLTYTESVNHTSGHGNGAWSCLDLLEILCQLAERGHLTSVRLMLEYPIANCPNLLLAGIAQINTVCNLLQYEVTSSMFTSILLDPAKQNIIRHMWSVNHNLVLRGFLDAQSDLLTILDVCQELKILVPLLAVAPISFSINLAALASKKEYINLEKWLEESLDSYKDAFFEECLVYLREFLADVAPNAADSPLQPSNLAVLNAHRETCSILLKVLQSYNSRVTSPQLFEEFNRLHASLNPKFQDPATAYPRNSGGSCDVIEAESNAYFQQMFSEQLSISAMVQMLARFKESPEKREQLIFDCMIRNLFEEYKFYPKYPDKQLKLAAVLFGSLIKHQLVSHLPLGIALRAVLDALRKSVDSKMFMFGVKALEQFVDRLVEWPQYCNHILQISHLRGSHTELVSVIERTLARISSSQSELNGGNTISVDHQEGSPPASVELTEPSDVSWPLSSGTTQPVLQVSPFQLQGSHGSLEDRLKTTVTPANYTKPLLPHGGQSSVVSPPLDSASSQKATISQSLSTQFPSNSSGSAPAVPPSPSYPRPSRPTGLRQTPYTTGFGAALNIETLVAAAERRETHIEAPASEVQDKIFFMINNLSTANVDAKSKEFTDVFNEQYHPWFAQYMVMKRASIEPNFHDLYMKFLEKVNSKSLNKEILKVSYENCKVLLRSDLIKSSSEERSLLKNLGSWLGKLTIGRNQAVLAKEIDPKFLIVEAYEKGLMIAVIPFTSKLLEPCQSSLAYRPPNPWTMGILGLLVEIYNLPNLKMNLKFDIEVLFKNLGVEMKAVMPTSLLKDKVREVEGNPDFSKQDVSAPQQPVTAEANPGTIQTMNQAESQPEVNISSNPSTHPNVLTQYAGPIHLPANTMVEDDKSGAILVPERISSAQGLTQVAPSASPFSSNQLANMLPRSDSYININPKLSSMGLQLPYHRIIQVAMDNAIKEIVAPVIQRSVTIASRTTKELILKDYAMESDDNVISRAACLMVGALAGSLAHVTCKEPLRVALVNHLRNLLQNLNVGERSEQIVQILTTDHLDLGCAMIEDVASGKAVELIDADIGPSFASIRKQRELSGSAYYDAGTYGQGPFGRVPEALRPKPGRLSVAQQRVYNDFIRNIWQSQPNQSTNSVSGGPPGMSGNSGNTSLPRIYGSSSGQINSGIMPASQVAAGLNSAVQSLDPNPEESDRCSTQLPSVSSTHVGTNDGSIQSSTETRSPALSIPSTTTSELPLVEPSNVDKESTAILPVSPTTSDSQHSETLLTVGDVLDKYQLIAQKLETLIAKDARDADIQVIVAEVPDIILRCVSRDEAALTVSQKVFKSLYENALSGLHVASYLAILAAVRDICKLVVKELTNLVIYSDEDQKFNKEIAVGLIRSELLNLAEYSVNLATLLDGGRNKTALEFTISLLQALLLQETGFNTSELYHVMDVLTKLSLRPGAPESLQQLIETAKNVTANTNSLSGFSAVKEEKATQSKDKKILSGRSTASQEEFDVNESLTPDPPGFFEKVSHLFDEWCRICDLPVANETMSSRYISQLQQNGLLKCDGVTDRVFRIFTVLSVARSFVSDNSLSQSALSIQSTQHHKHLSFFAVDAYAKFVVLVLKYCSSDQGLSKSFLLPKILSVTVRVIQKDAEEKKTSFNPRPYFRLFVNLLLDVTASDPLPEGANFQVLTCFANAFLALQPLKVPGWSFAWLELVSHRSFMPKLLTINSPKGWYCFQRLLVALFKFMEPYLRKAELGEPVHFLYKGTLRVLLVLLHDFPEFLCDFHFNFCDVIPPSCIQLRNVILSAFPRNMRLPDPSTPNLKIDLLAEISQSPRILSDVDGALKTRQIKHDIDVYLKTKPEGSSFLTDLKQRLLLPQNEASVAGTRYDVPLINSLVLYIGMQAIQQLQSKSPQHASQQMAHNPPMDIFLVGAAMDIFKCLIKTLDTEGRYLFLNAVANQLRYPNNHTHYFSFILLFLFAEDIIQEQITRVLLERLIVNRPHPWGLLITFIELIKNPRYDFWSRPFTRCDPEIEKLFQQVSRSCGGPKTLDDGIVPAGMPDGNH